MEAGKRAPHTQTPPRSATGQVPAFHLAALPRVRRWSRWYGVWVPGSCPAVSLFFDNDQKIADELKATVKETWASIPPQQCHKLITSMPRRIEAVIKAKGELSTYHTHFLFIGLMKYSNLLRFVGFLLNVSQNHHN